MTRSRHSETRRRKRQGSIELRRKRDKPPTYERRRAGRTYPVVVTHERDSQKPTERQQQLAKWFQDVVAEKDALGWSRSYTAKKSTLSRKDFYRWMNPEEIPRSPRLETVHRICDGLKLDFNVPAAIMGYSGLETPSDLEEKLRRVDAILKMKTLTDAQRDKYEGMKRDYQSVYGNLVDTIIKEYEREHGSTPAGDEPERGE